MTEVTVTVNTLADFDRAVANGRQRINELIAEQAAREVAALAALTEQIQQSEAEALRVDAERNRLALIANFENGALADARATFTELNERAADLRTLIAQCERMHEAIATAALGIQNDAYAAVDALVGALPERNAESATDALQSAGADGLRAAVPGWLLAIWPRRWLTAPGTSADALYQYARALAKQKR